MDLYSAIRVRALRSVLHPDQDYQVRKILRWYSKSLCTPIREVEELPFEDVLQAYYEEHYAGLTADQLEDERAELIITEEERYQLILAEEAEEAETFEMSKLILADEKKKATEAAQEKKALIADLVHQKAGPIRVMELPETDLPSMPQAPPPGITMTFVDQREFEAELDGFGSMSQPPKPRQ